MKNLLKLLVIIFVLAVFSKASMALAKETNAKPPADGDKADAAVEEILQKIKDETLTDEEKEKMLDKLKKLIEKADNEINKKRIEIQKIEEEIKPIENRKSSLSSALDELISYAPRISANNKDTKTEDKSKKNKKDKKNK